MIVDDFGALDQSQIDRVNAVIARAQSAATQADSLVPGVVDSLWSDMIGAGPTANALRSNAAAADAEAQTLATTGSQIIADPTSSEADVQNFEAALPSLSNTAAQQAAALLTPSAAVQAVGAGFKSPFGIPLAVWGVGAAALVALYVVGRVQSLRR